MHLSQFESITEITKGMSGDKKYRVERDGKAFLLRISDSTKYEEKKKEFQRLAHLSRAGLPVPECVFFGKDEETGEVMTLLSWLEGEVTEELLPRMSAAEQYGYGCQAGRILRQIHETTKVSEIGGGWYDRYFGVIDRRLESYRREGKCFEGSDKILSYIETQKELLKTRPMCGHHGDYHTGNLLIHESKVRVIDWHTIDFDNIGDPWYEFNRIATEHPAFARGQIDGYFENQVPEEFWKLFALYLAASAITSIVWAQYYAPEELENIMALNRRVMELFDGMENPMPKWYREGGN